MQEWEGAVSTPAKRPGRLIAIGLAALALFVLPCFAGLYFSCRQMGPAKGGARRVATAFIEKLASGHTEQAWAMTTKEFRENASVDGLRRFVQQVHLDEYQGVDFTGWKVEQAVVGTSRAMFDAKIRLRSRDPLAFHITLEQSGGAWRVRGFRFDLPLGR